MKEQVSKIIVKIIKMVGGWRDNLIRIQQISAFIEVKKLLAY